MGDRSEPERIRGESEHDEVAPPWLARLFGSFLAVLPSSRESVIRANLVAPLVRSRPPSPPPYSLLLERLDP